MSTAAKSRAEIFDEVLSRYSGPILHYLFSRCNDMGIAEDLSQTFWAYIDRKFTPHEMQQRPFLYRKAHNVWLDYYRKHTHRRPDLAFTDELPEPVQMPFRSEPESAIEDEELFDRFWELFYPDEYDETSKLIFWLHHRYGYTMEEISERIGVSKSTAHDKLKCLKQLCLDRLEAINTSNL